MNSSSGTYLGPNPRKITKFETCGRHAWLNGTTRSRRAGMFMEGGPADLAGCIGGRCRIWPGTDLFVPTICHDEYELEWNNPETYTCTSCGDTVNTINSPSRCRGPNRIGNMHTRS